MRGSLIAAGQSRSGRIVATAAIACLVWGAGSARIAAAQSRGAPAVHVVDASTGAPVASAEVLLPAAGLAWRTTGEGIAVLAGAPRGRHLVQVRRVGYAPFAGFMDVAARDSLPMTVTLTPLPAELPTVRVEAERSREARLLALRGFDERRRSSGAPRSAFWTRDDIDRIGAVRWTDLASRVLGAGVDARGNLRLRCGRPVIILDGVKLGNDELRDIPLADVAGVELYSGAAQVPARFNVTASAGGRPGCVAVVWTR